MPQFQNICVFCGSSSQVSASFFDAARQLGKLLADNGIGLVYGAGSIGLMGALADATLQAGGRVTGVIPQFMVDADWHHKGLTQLLITDTMHTRKARMAELSDAVVALPGGIGTFEELFETLTWKQLGLLTKPVVVVNVDGYYDALLKQLSEAVDAHFMRPVHTQMWSVVSSAAQVLDALAAAPAWDNSVRKFAAI